MFWKALETYFPDMYGAGGRGEQVGARGRGVELSGQSEVGRVAGGWLVAGSGFSSRRAPLQTRLAPALALTDHMAVGARFQPGEEAPRRA